jgi:hypothetical protein
MTQPPKVVCSEDGNVGGKKRGNHEMRLTGNRGKNPKAAGKI